MTRCWTAELKGHWPVGACGFVIASDANEAARLLSKAIREAGMPEQTITPFSLVEIDISTPRAVILNDGDY